MDFSSIINEQGYKYIESPVIYKFPSEKFINFKLNNQSPSQNGNSNQLSINKIGEMLFRRQHQQRPQSNNENPPINNNNKHELQVNSIVVQGRNSFLKPGHLINTLNQGSNTININQKNPNINNSTAKSNTNGKGLFGIDRIEQSSEVFTSNPLKQYDKMDFQFGSSQEVNIKLLSQNKIPNLNTSQQQPKHRSNFINTFPSKQSSQNIQEPKSAPIQQQRKQAKSTQEFPYYKKMFSPQRSSTLINFKPLSPRNGSLALPPRPSNAAQQINRMAANELIYETQRQLLQNQISTLKIQLKTYQDKVEQLNQQKEQWVRCKKRNQILEREYKLLNDQFIRMKESSLDIKRKSSQVQKFDLREIGSQEEFGRRALFKKRSSDQYRIESQLKQYQERIFQLGNQINFLNKTNRQLNDQKIKLTEQNMRIKLASFPTNVSKQPHILQKQIISLKQQNIKLQQQKHSYVQNYKLLKNQQQKQCRQLKLKQQQIHQSLQKLNHQINMIKQEKDTLQHQNKKLKNKNRQLDEQLQVLIKKYSTIKYDYEQMNQTLQMNTQQSNFAKNQDKHFQLLRKIQSITQKHGDRIIQMTTQHDRQREDIKQKYEKKLSDFQNKINQLRCEIRQRQNTLRDKQEKLRQKQEIIREKNRIIQTNEQKMRQKQYKMNEKDIKLKQNQERISKDYEQKLIRQVQQRQKEYQQRLNKQMEAKSRQYEQRLSRQLEEKQRQYQQKLIKNHEKVSSSNQTEIIKHQHEKTQIQQQIKAYQTKLKQHQKLVNSLQHKKQSKQILLSKKQLEIDQLIKKRQQMWVELLQIKQKYLELNQINMSLITDKNHMKEQLTKKDEEKNFLRNNFQIQLNQLNSVIISKQQHEASVKQAHQNTLIRKNNEIKKQRAQIQGLLMEVVKLRQVKNHNYKLMVIHKNHLQLDQTITHLWAVKQTQYENISQLLGQLNDPQ